MKQLISNVEYLVQTHGESFVLGRNTDHSRNDYCHQERVKRCSDCKAIGIVILILFQRVCLFGGVEMRIKWLRIHHSKRDK